MVDKYLLLPQYLSNPIPSFLVQTCPSIYSGRELLIIFRSSPPGECLGKGVLKISSKFTGEHPCRSAISIKLPCNIIKIALWHGCSPVNLLDILRTPFLKNTSGGLLVNIPQYKEK